MIYNEMKFLDIRDIKLEFLSLNREIGKMIWKVNIVGNFLNLPIGQMKQYKFDSIGLTKLKSQYETFTKDIISDLEAIQNFLNDTSESKVLHSKNAEYAYFLNSGFVFEVKLQKEGKYNELSFRSSDTKINPKKSWYDLKFDYSNRPPVDSNITMSKVFEIGKFLAKKKNINVIKVDGFKEGGKTSGEMSARDRFYRVLLSKKFGKDKIKPVKGRHGFYFLVNIK